MVRMAPRSNMRENTKKIYDDSRWDLVAWARPIRRGADADAGGWVGEIRCGWTHGLLRDVSTIPTTSATTAITNVLHRTSGCPFTVVTCRRGREAAGSNLFLGCRVAGIAARVRHRNNNSTCTLHVAARLLSCGNTWAGIRRLGDGCECRGDI